MSLLAHENETLSPLRMTFEEFLDWDEEGVKVEWVNGEVQRMSPNTITHLKVRGFLESILGAYIDTNRLGIVLSEQLAMRCHPQLPVRLPDIAFIARENFHLLKEKYLEGPADIVVEIVSEDSVKRDYHTKFSEYEQGGVREYWIIDPMKETASFFYLDEVGRFAPIHQDDSEIFRSVVLPGFWLNVQWLRGNPFPRLLDVLREWQLIPKANS